MHTLWYRGLGVRGRVCYDRDLSRRSAVETKQQILKAIEELPDNASVEDAIERLYLLYKIEKGLRQADSGDLIGQDEARQRMARWLK